MVTAEENSRLFQHYSACHSPKSMYMSTSVKPGQPNSSLSPVKECTISVKNAAHRVFAARELQDLGTYSNSENRGFFHYLPPRVESFSAAANPHIGEVQSPFNQGYGITAIPNAVSGLSQKRFIIFDQSGSNTRMFFTPICSPTKFAHAFNLQHGTHPAGMGLIIPTNSTIEEKSDENQIIGEEAEMGENAEEINALLYSSSFDDDGDDSDEDEVTSTGHSPFPITRHNKHEPNEEISCKRRRLLDGGYEESSPLCVMKSVKLDISWEEDDGNDAESNCVMGNSQEEDTGCACGIKRSRKDNIRETLKILERIIPGVKSKDPLSIVEEAIHYLKHLKIKALDLGVSELS